MDLDAAKRRRGGGPVGLQLAAVRGRGLLSAFLLSDGQPSCAGDEAVRLGGPRSFLPLPVSCVGLPLNLLRWTCRSRARLFVADAPPIMAVSRAYGARQCGTHTPTTLRPGLIAEAIRDAFAAAGYPLLTDYPATRGMIEVYPHPALVELAQADRRLPYKISRMRSYWPIDNPSDRRLKLLHVWRRIIDLLQHQISGVCDALPLPLHLPSAQGLRRQARRRDLRVGCDLCA